MLNKLSRKDIELLNALAQTPEGKSALHEYIEQHEKAVKAYKVYRESVVVEVEVDKVVKPVGTKRKFKAGDKVRVTSVASDVATTTGLSVGDVAEVITYKNDLPEGWSFIGRRPVIVTGGRSRRAYFEESALELVEEKSPNELRAEVIQRAKEFIENTKTKEFTGRVITGAGLPGEGRTNTHYDVYVFGDKPKHVCDVEFIVHQEKHTVVALMRGFLTRKVYSKGIAKCNPSDVFNEHIGKAIALGRALGKDVSEFENAVQPNKLTVGMVIRRKYYESTVTYEREIEKVEGEVLRYTCGGYDEDIHSSDNLTIINDTNAQYGGIK